MPRTTVNHPETQGHGYSAAGTTFRSELVAGCVQKITEAIKHRRYQSNQRLGEAALAKELGYGRAQIRAALDHLAHAGIVDRRPRLGTFVRSLSIRRYIELAEVRATLEGFAARTASNSLDDEELKKLEDLAARLDTALQEEHETWETLLEMEANFHGRLAKAANNRTMVEIIVQHNFLARHLTEGRLIKIPTCVLLAPDAARGEHLRIIDALASRNPEVAEHEVRNHILQSLYVQIKLFLRFPGTDTNKNDLCFAKQWLARASLLQKSVNDHRQELD